MKPRLVLPLFGWLVVSAGGPAQAASFTLGFEGCPRDVVEGRAGEAKTFEVFATLGIQDNDSTSDGVEGWSFSLGITGGTIRAIELQGIIMSYYVDDGDPSTPPAWNYNYRMDLAEAFVAVAELATWKDDPARSGAVSEARLDAEGLKLLRYSVHRIARLVVEVTVPGDTSRKDVVLTFQDGFQGTGLPVRNLVTFAGAPQVPSLGGCRFKVQRGPQFALGFAGLPEGPVEGYPGEVKTVEVYAALTTSENPFPQGAQGWSVSLEVIGATVRSIEVKGVVVDATLQVWSPPPDPNLGPFYQHYPLDLGTCFTSFAAPAPAAVQTGCAPPLPVGEAPLPAGAQGAVTAIVLDPLRDGKRYASARLQPNGTQRIARLLLEVTVPLDEAEREVVLRFMDCLRSATSQPVRNVVTSSSRSYHPVLGESRFTVRDADRKVSLGFEGCPGRPLVGAPGEVKTVALFPTLTVTGNLSPEGPESWAVSLGVTGGTIRAFELQGVTVSTIFDQDGDPATPPLDPYLLDLASAWRDEAELATRDDDPAREGAISLVVLGGPEKTVLQPNGIQRIGRLLVDVPVPRGEPREVVVRFEDGFRSSGLPRVNWVNFTDSYVQPALGECRFTVEPGTGGRQVPGDSSQDGALDLSDAVSLLGTLFLGTPERLPCGDGSTTDPGNVELLDWQADGSVDISDVIALLQFLFLDGPPHALAPEDPALGGCVTLEECSSRATCP